MREVEVKDPVAPICLDRGGETRDGRFDEAEALERQSEVVQRVRILWIALERLFETLPVRDRIGSGDVHRRSSWRVYERDLFNATCRVAAWGRCRGCGRRGHLRSRSTHRLIRLSSARI